MLEELIKNKLFKISLAIYFLMIFAFSRSFMGIYIFGFRVGELSILFSMLILTYVICINIFKKNKNSNTIDNTIFLIVIFFVVNSFFSDSSLINPYTYKASSYVWSLGFFYLGLIYFKYNNLNKHFINICLFLLVYVYYVAIYDLPYRFQELVLNISDKYEPHKGSDLVILFVTTFYLLNRHYKGKRVAIEIFAIMASLYLPLLLFKSRAGFISLAFFVMFEIFNNRNTFKGYTFRNIILLIISTIFAIQSTFLISKSGFIQLEKTRESVSYVTDYRVPELADEEFFELFYIRDGRLRSSDVNLNWRIEIWQDVLFDIQKENLFLTGYGYKEKIPAMSALDFEGNSVRSGLDGLNENVHNFFVNIFARGGIIHLLMYLYLIFQFSKFGSEKFNFNIFLTILFPLFFTSSFDASMENSHFPLIFYFFVGLIFNNKKVFKN